jgi:hypothetical protein
VEGSPPNELENRSEKIENKDLHTTNFYLLIPNYSPNFSIRLYKAAWFNPNSPAARLILPWCLSMACLSNLG